MVNYPRSEAYPIAERSTLRLGASNALRRHELSFDFLIGCLYTLPAIIPLLPRSYTDWDCEQGAYRRPILCHHLYRNPDEHSTIMVLRLISITTHTRFKVPTYRLAPSSNSPIQEHHIGVSSPFSLLRDPNAEHFLHTPSPSFSRS